MLETVSVERCYCCHAECHVSTLDIRYLPTYLHRCYSAPESVASLQQPEVFEAILGEVAGGGEAGDAAADDEDLVVVVCVGVWARVCHGWAGAGHSHNILCALYYCQQLTGN